MKSLKKFIPFVAVAALGVGHTSIAQADVQANALLSITNFQLVNDATGTALNNINDVVIQAGNNFGTLAADLQSVGGIAAENQSEVILSGSGGQFDGTPQCQGAGCLPFANNNFAVSAPPPASTYAYSDNNLQGASIDLDTDGNGTIDINAGVTAQTRADVSLIDADQGTSTSTTGTNTTLQFTPGTDLTLRLSFDFVAQALAFVSNNSAAPSTATAGVSWGFTVEDLVTGVTTAFSPGELQLTASRTDVSAQFNETQDFTNIGAFQDTFDVIGGNTYQLGITHQVQSNAQNNVQVPEPHVLALLGIGLLAMVAPARLRRKV